MGNVIVLSYDDEEPKPPLVYVNVGQGSTKSAKATLLRKILFRVNTEPHSLGSQCNGVSNLALLYLMLFFARVVAQYSRKGVEMK